MHDYPMRTKSSKPARASALVVVPRPQSPAVAAGPALPAETTAPAAGESKQQDHAIDELRWIVGTRNKALAKRLLGQAAGTILRGADQDARKPWKDPMQSGAGRLKNGSPSGDPSAAPRCGAKTRRGTRCEAPGMANGRCRMHGGKSTGPRTAEGLERCRTANWKHGLYSQESVAERRCVRDLVRESWRSLVDLTRALAEAKTE